jgi:hypothetical protein
MGGPAEVSFYRDLLHKPVIDCDGRPVGEVLDVAAGPAIPSAQVSTFQRLVSRPISWDLVEQLEAARGQIHLHLPREAIHVAAHRSPQTAG